MLLTKIARHLKPRPFITPQQWYLRASSTTTTTTDSEQAPEIFMDIVDEAFLDNESKIASIINTTKPYTVIDNFFPADVITQLRREAVHLRKQGNFVTSQSERNGVTYEKHNVEAMQLDGGDIYYDAPRLHEYVVQAARTLPSLLSNGDIDLDGTYAANKLAVCFGNGASYDKHLDNSGNGDTRKLTCLLYLNEVDTYDSKLGGEFRLWYHDDDTNKEQIIDIEPKGGRMICFFSDSLVHAVMPTTIESEADHRYALTVWLPTAKGVSDIEEDKVKEEYHWGEGSTLANEIGDNTIERI